MNRIAQPLKKGDTIGLVSPSSPVSETEFKSGWDFLNRSGFRIKLGKNIFAADRFLAGNDNDRSNDIMEFFKDPQIKAIIATRGGQGSQRVLPFLDYNLIHQNPKRLIGFSDTTALQLGILKMGHLVSYTGFTLTTHSSPQIKQTLHSCLLGKTYKVSYGQMVHSGVVKGPLVGGNLTLLTNLMGTPYLPSLKGCILLIEDIGIEPYNIDGMLSQLDLAGVFKEISGIIFGIFEECESRNPKDGTIDEVINEWSLKSKVPTIKNFSYGHGKESCVLPIGGNIILDADNCTVHVL